MTNRPTEPRKAYVVTLKAEAMDDTYEEKSVGRPRRLPSEDRDAN